ncbi:hypothetical protein PV325_004865 [Microctonus aethiopoides]|uniref:Uncharacterized protein n=1 Tax=Microctonus aethiopoides TaxID=144406 RepID=A0AA39C9D6_9HYME|nr:hypothetical protein PV325_004865 [Microctonus aethiopoides]KAK0084855.1 hypothetical protein PV326_006127 [Microctonus aethiopoides]KAK0160315.1 hypothetical protein PV328_007742 [Microctonus aethiopoides]
MPYKILKSSKTFIKAFIEVSKINDRDEQELRKTIEKFVCRMYGFQSIDDVHVARMATFTKAYKVNEKTDISSFKNKINGATFPLCKSELHHHILRTSYIAHLWSHAHSSTPTEFSLTDFG